MEFSLQEYKKVFSYKELSSINELIEYKIYNKLTPIGTEVHVEYNSILFQINLSLKYPFFPPTVFCNTVSLFPSISDGRDLLSIILNCE